MAWTAIIAGYACQGKAPEAPKHFKRMQDCGVRSNEVTFIAVLTACSHSALVTEGRQDLELMSSEYGVVPTVDHYDCMVGIYSRAGFLQEALELIRSMPFSSHAKSWKYFLGGKWKEAASVRKMMTQRSLRKEVSCSWITVKGKVLTLRRKIPIQNWKLEALNDSVIKDETDLLRGNLRACKDCHDFGKQVSLITGCEIIVRDSFSFHPIKLGDCSCNDYRPVISRKCNMNQSWYENSLYKVISDRLVHLQMMIRNYLYYAIIFWWGYKVRMYSVKLRLCELPRLRVSNTSKLQTWGFSVHDCDRFDYIMCDYAFLGVHMAPCDAAVHIKLPYVQLDYWHLQILAVLSLSEMEVAETKCSSGYGKPPWLFKGSALYQLHLVKSKTARAFIPKEFRLVEAFGYTLGGFFLASYEDSPAGVFDELVVIAGTVWNPPTSCAWAARVLVNSGDACDHGRKMPVTQQRLQKSLLGMEKMPTKMVDDQRNERALPTIHICLSDEVHSENIAASLWLRLESLCMMKSLTNNLYLKHCLFMLWMEEGASIKTHLDEFNSIVVDLRSIDVTVEREDEVLEVGLPSQVAKFSKKITAVPRQRRSKFSGFLDKIGLGTTSSSTKSCMDVLVTETNDRSTTDICNINLTAVVPGMKFDKWKGPAIKMSLPSFSGRTEYNPSLLKYSCSIECRVRAVRAAKVSRPSLTSKQDAEESLSEHERQNLTISVMLSKPILALEFSCLSMQVEAPVVVSQHSTSSFYEDAARRPPAVDDPRQSKDSIAKPPGVSS
ncbi:hypothetical protein NC652_009414 [Populus alba x Populus x berolinensis]|nr:hypothetical protein NC652_009414 [Populus alba x Populus x berolinensis]